MSKKKKKLLIILRLYITLLQIYIKYNFNELGHKTYRLSRFEEKYQNIKAYTRIKRLNPALHTHHTCVYGYFTRV